MRVSVEGKREERARKGGNAKDKAKNNERRPHLTKVKREKREGERGREPSHGIAPEAQSQKPLEGKKQTTRRRIQCSACTGGNLLAIT